MNPAYKAQFQELTDEYRRQLPGKFAELDGLWRALCDGSVAPARLVDLHRELHTLVGTAQTLGVPAVTRAARGAEEFLGPYATRGVMPAAAKREEFEQLLGALKQSALEP